MRLLQWLVSSRLTDPGRVTALLDIALVGTVGLLAYLGLARVMRVSEVTEVLGMLRRRLPGSR
jgi:putative peptidoglycan lipid II flippase